MIDMQKPLVTVFIPYYNDNKFLRKAIDAVLASTYGNFELILLNHATTDDCREIAHSYTDKRIKHLDLPVNLGAGSGLLTQKALEIAEGKYFKPLCADDMILPDGLEKLVNYMESNHDKDFAFGNVEYIDENGKDLNVDWFSNKKDFSIEYDEIEMIRIFTKGISFLPYIGSIIKTDNLRKISINTTFIMTFDMSLWLGLLCSGAKIGFVNDKVCYYRIHEKQMSSTNNEYWVRYCSWYEHTLYWKTLFSINDIALVKKVFNNESFCKHLTEKGDIPFVIAHALIAQWQPYAYGFIAELFQDREYREHLINVFGYGIRELRKDLNKMCKLSLAQTSANTSDDLSLYKRFKRALYSKPVRELCLLDIGFLAVRRLIDNITFKNFRQKYSKHRRYSL